LDLCLIPLHLLVTLKNAKRKKELERQSWQIDALDKMVEREYVTWVITCHCSHEVLAHEKN
jgi:hypothetical protein